MSENRRNLRFGARFARTRVFMRPWVPARAWAQICARFSGVYPSCAGGLKPDSFSNELKLKLTVSVRKSVSASSIESGHDCSFTSYRTTVRTPTELAGSLFVI